MPDINPIVLLAFISGLLVDFDYAMTRLRGFGRLVFSQIPVHDKEAVESEQDAVSDQPEDHE